MIRKLLNGDIDRVADIWLKTNLKAHYFISNQYWKSNYELVKEMMWLLKSCCLARQLIYNTTLSTIVNTFFRFFL